MVSPLRKPVAPTVHGDGGAGWKTDPRPGETNDDLQLEATCQKEVKINKNNVLRLQKSKRARCLPNSANSCTLADRESCENGRHNKLPTWNRRKTGCVESSAP